MTGLLSRTGFDARLAEVLVGVGRGAGRIALLAIDLDRFKAVNDDYGHGTGDQVIREVGARLQAFVRLTDAAVRLGGDEFGVLLVGVSDAAAAEALAWKIHRSLCEPIETDRATDHDRGVDRRLRPRAGGRMPTIERLHAISDQEMFLMKADGGGVRVRASSDPISSDQAAPAGRVGTSRRRRTCPAHCRRVPLSWRHAQPPGRRPRWSPARSATKAPARRSSCCMPAWPTCGRGMTSSRRSSRPAIAWSGTTRAGTARRRPTTSRSRSGPTCWPCWTRSASAGPRSWAIRAAG